jgi:hypothetical protein
MKAKPIEQAGSRKHLSQFALEDVDFRKEESFGSPRLKLNGISLLWHPLITLAVVRPKKKAPRPTLPERGDRTFAACYRSIY